MKMRQWRWLVAGMVLGCGAMDGWGRSMRVVDFGHDWGVGFYRNTPPVSFGVVDVDGDGSTADEHARGWPFSWTVPLNPTENTYDWQLPSARFYGGVYVAVSKRASARTSSAPSEGHINQNHELRDDWNLMALPSVDLQPELEQYEAAGLWMWKKEDFLNGGDAHRVSFSDDSDYVAVFVSRYWGGVDWGRWVVANDGQFFVSEPTFGGRTVRIDASDADPLANEAGTNPVTRTAHIVYPKAVRWAPYDPQRPAPQAMFFDWKAGPDYQFRTFDAVEAVGFLVQRDLAYGARASSALTLREPIAVKFNAVQVVATVERPETGSYYLDLLPVAQGTGGPALWAARTEVTYRDWLRVVQWAVSNQRARRFSDGSDRYLPGYHFESDGAIGSAEASLAEEHSPLEPVTSITWYDAIAWCNALSELEGLEPAYYADPNHTQPFRKILRRNVAAALQDRFPVYWKPSAQGFRLPTESEWRSLAGGSAATSDQAWTNSNSGRRTHPVGTLQGNALGLQDMVGNVAEYIWDAPGQVFDPASQTSRKVMGGSFRYPLDENAQTLLPFGSSPWEGSYSIGFRPVRSGGGTGSLPSPAGAVPERAFTRSLRVTQSEAPISLEQMRDLVRQTLPLVRVDGSGSLAQGSTNTSLRTTDAYALDVGKFEVPYALWTRVRQWAESVHGYRFNYRGDMGSARHNIHLSRGPAEPVTEISWFDAVVWCNALSELMGLDPVYRKQNGAVERVAPAFRLEMFDTYGYPNVGPHYPYDQQGRTERDTTLDYDLLPDPERSGFRLPTKAEAYLFGNTGREVNDSRNRTTLDRGWFRQNSGGKAQPVGTKLPKANDLHDILGNVQEWTYGGSGLFGQYRYGNDFGWGNNEYPHTMNREDHVSSARPYLGFRVVRRSNVVGRPRLTPETASFEHLIRLQVESVTPGAVFRYTLDGSEPSPTHGLLSDGFITLEQTATVKVIALHPHHDPSSVTSGTYTRLTGLPLGSPYPLIATNTQGHTRLDWTNHATAQSGFVIERRLLLPPEDTDPDVEFILDNARQQEVGTGSVELSNYWLLDDIPGFFGTNYLRRDASGSAYARFRPNLAGVEGPFEVFVWHPPNQWSILVTNQPVIVHHASGTTTVTVNGREGGGAWKSIGTYDLAVGSYVEFNNNFTISSGQSFADAVRFFRPGNVPDWEEIGRTGPEARHFVDTSPLPTRTYAYRVRATDGSSFGNSTETPPILTPFALRPELQAAQLHLRFTAPPPGTAWHIRILSSGDLSHWSDILYDSDLHGQPQSGQEHSVPAPIPGSGARFYRLELTPLSP